MLGGQPFSLNYYPCIGIHSSELGHLLCVLYVCVCVCLSECLSKCMCPAFFLLLHSLCVLKWIQVFLTVGKSCLLSVEVFFFFIEKVTKACSVLRSTFQNYTHNSPGTRVYLKASNDRVNRMLEKYGTLTPFLALFHLWAIWQCKDTYQSFPCDAPLLIHVRLAIFVYNK